MALRVYFGDLSVFQVVGGATFNLLSSTPNAKIAIRNDNADGASIKTLDSAPTFLKRGATLSVTTMSGTNLRVTNIDVSAFTMNSVDYLADLRGGDMQIAFTHDEGSGVGDIYEQPNPTGRVISGNVTLAIPTSAFPAVQARVLSDTIANIEFAFSITIGGTTITLPVFATSFEHSIDRDKIQLVKVGFTGKAPQDGTSYPTAAPSTSTSLLGTAFSEPRRILTYSMTTSASSGAGLNYAGSAVFDNVSFSFNDKSIIQTTYQLRTHGTITKTAA